MANKIEIKGLIDKEIKQITNLLDKANEDQLQLINQMINQMINNKIECKEPDCKIADCPFCKEGIYKGHDLAMDPDGTLYHKKCAKSMMYYDTSDDGDIWR